MKLAEERWHDVVCQRGDRRFFPAIAVLLPVAILGGCAKAVPVPASPAQYHEFTVVAPRERVFDAMLKVGQKNNLNVAVLEKSSGLVRFDSATLSADQLDDFCVYPFTRSRTGKPLWTFATWNQKSLRADTGPVRVTNQRTATAARKVFPEAVQRAARLLGGIAEGIGEARDACG